MARGNLALPRMIVCVSDVLVVVVPKFPHGNVRSTKVGELRPRVQLPSIRSVNSGGSSGAPSAPAPLRSFVVMKIGRVGGWQSGGDRSVAGDGATYRLKTFAASSKPFAK